MVFLTSTAFTQWPGLHHDGSLYTTPIITSAAIGRWEFDSYIPLLVELGNSSFNLHGQLYQFIFGRVLHTGDYESLFRWTSALTVVTYMAYLLLGCKLLKFRYPRAGKWIATGIAAVSALACIYLQGRPEYLLPLFTVIPFAMRESRVTASSAKPMAYVLVGMIFILSPIPGLLYAMTIVAWLAIRGGSYVIRELFLYGTLSVILALVALLFICPVSPWQWLLNTISVGASVSGPINDINIFNFGQFGSPALLVMPFWNVFCLSVFALLLLALIRHQLWWLALLYTLVLFAILMPKTNIYSYVGFMPALMIAMLGKEEKLLLLNAKLRLLSVILVCSFSLCGCLGLSRAVLLAIVYNFEGVSFKQTSESVRMLEDKLTGVDEKIGFVWLTDPSFEAFSRSERFLMAITLTGRENEIDLFMEAYESRFRTKIMYVIFPQVGHIASPPPTLNSGMFVLTTNGWAKHPAMIFGMKLGGAMPGYQYALYRRKEATP